MSYKVTMLNADYSVYLAKFYLSRSQAIHRMRLLAYDRLKAFGKLDTKAAHNVMSEIDSCDDIMPPQEQRKVIISNTGFSLILSNTARAPR